MHLFYDPRIQGDGLVLEEQESRHAIRVLRLQKGDPVIVVDGRGGWYEAIIEEDHVKACRIRILNKTEDYQASSYGLHLAVAPTKNMDRFEWFLEKATEIGISEITPLICQRSERKQVKKERLERILVSAMKQSLRAYKPRLNPPLSLTEFVQQRYEGILAMAHCYPLDRKGINQLPQDVKYTFLVGPEGDFTEEEVAEALEGGYIPVTLGEYRLRTETAALYITVAISNLHS